MGVDGNSTWVLTKGGPERGVYTSSGARVNVYEAVHMGENERGERKRGWAHVVI
jgi:hypothetical protein